MTVLRYSGGVPHPGGGGGGGGYQKYSRPWTGNKRPRAAGVAGGSGSFQNTAGGHRGPIVHAKKWVRPRSPPSSSVDTTAHPPPAMADKESSSANESSLETKQSTEVESRKPKPGTSSAAVPLHLSADDERTVIVGRNSIRFTHKNSNLSTLQSNACGEAFASKQWRRSEASPQEAQERSKDAGAAEELPAKDNGTIVPSTETSKPAEEQGLKKVGKNKLVLRPQQRVEANDRSGDSVTVVRNWPGSNPQKASTAETSLTRVAPNKLVSSNHKPALHAHPTPSVKHYQTHSNQRFGNQAHGGSQNFSRVGYGGGPNHHRKPKPAYLDSSPAAKRIKLDPSHQNFGEIAKQASSSESEDENETNLNQDGDTEQKGKPEKILTDFAYRETSGGHGASARGGYGGYHSRKRRSSRSMGLVRVKPDESKTPICPTFLKGMPCTDVSCMKRHDVPMESAMPVCMFFQQKGMCMREDCPFRHVKVNPRATPCPTFARLGFCDDPKCALMHNRPAPASRKWSHSKAKA